MSDELPLERRTVFSPDRKYRYTLWRHWESQHVMFADMPPPKVGFVQFIGLNPSTADETDDDPTIAKCTRMAKRWGYAEFCMTNLFAFRSTDPRLMKLETEPIGPDNDEWLLAVAHRAALIIAAWGSFGSKGRDKVVVSMLRKAGKQLHCLKLSAHGIPWHPLFLLDATDPIPWNL